MIQNVIREEVRSAIARHGLIAPGERVLAAVSGGSDSVALLRLLQALRDELSCELFVAHVNHGLRGQAGDADARFVERLAASLGLPCAVLQPSAEDGAVLTRARGSEEAARRVRHRLLAGAAREAGCARIALGHTMDDQAETVLMRLIRGAGRRGLSGMRSLGPGILIRPLLGVRRAALRGYLEDMGQGFREDETNAQPRFLRNRVRAGLMPELVKLNPSIVVGMAHAAGLLGEEDRYLDELARREVACWARPAAAPGPGGAEIRFPAGMLAGMPLPLRRRAARLLLRAAGGDPRGAAASAVAGLLELAARPAGAAALDLPGGMRAHRQQLDVVLTSGAGRNLPAPFCVDLPIPGRVELPGGLGILEARLVESGWSPQRLEAEKRAGGLDERRVLLDAAALGAAARVRSRLAGDQFHPMGGAGRRKVSDFLIDRKVPRGRRSAVPLVVGSAGIAWVVGFRPAEEYRVTRESKQVVALIWLPAERRLE